MTARAKNQIRTTAENLLARRLGRLAEVFVQPVLPFY